MATIKSSDPDQTFSLTVPDEDTPAVPFSSLFVPMANSILEQLVLLKNRVQSMQTFDDKVSAVPGWSIQFQWVIVYGENIANLHLQLKRTGANITVPNTGNMANQIVANMKSGFEAQGESALGPADTGRELAGYVTSDGTVKLSSSSSGYDIATNDVISLVGMFILNNPVRSSF